MKNKSKLCFILGTVFLFIFILFTAAVSYIDVMPIGPEGSSVGLASLNAAVRDAIGTSPVCYKIAEICGVICLLYPIFLAGIGFLQLIKRRGLFKVDQSILLIGVFYAVVLATYVIFEMAEINYRPVLTDGALEASYPSSHTILAICFTLSALIPLAELLSRRRAVYIGISVFSVLLLIITVVTRFLSGVHWFTDIIGGVIISSALVLLYAGAVNCVRERSIKKTCKN